MNRQEGKIITNKPLVVMTLILGEEECRKCSKIVKEVGIYGGITIIGKGTVNSAILKLLGIKDQKKEILNFLMTKERSEELIDHFTEELGLTEPGKGIIYITPVVLASMTENGRQVIVKTTEGEDKEDKKDMFKKLTVVVDRGMGGEVMDIALNAESEAARSCTAEAPARTHDNSLRHADRTGKRTGYDSYADRSG